MFDGKLLDLCLSRQRNRLFFLWCAISSFSRIPAFWERKL